jgi:hypothetical protein
VKIRRRSPRSALVPQALGMTLVVLGDDRVDRFEDLLELYHLRVGEGRFELEA